MGGRQVRDCNTVADNTKSHLLHSRGMMKTDLPLVITRVRDQARITRSFDLRAAGGQRVEFISGQVAILRVAGQDPAYFAFASAPEDPELEVLVKQKIGGSNVIFNMHEGEVIELVGVAGQGFALEEQEDKDVVFVGMGTGGAPLRSAVR